MAKRSIKVTFSYQFPSLQNLIFSPKSLAVKKPLFFSLSSEPMTSSDVVLRNFF